MMNDGPVTLSAVHYPTANFNAVNLPFFNVVLGLGLSCRLNMPVELVGNVAILTGWDNGELML